MPSATLLRQNSATLAFSKSRKVILGGCTMLASPLSASICGDRRRRGGWMGWLLVHGSTSAHRCTAAQQRIPSAAHPVPPAAWPQRRPGRRASTAPAPLCPSADPAFAGSAWRPVQVAGAGGSAMRVSNAGCAPPPPPMRSSRDHPTGPPHLRLAHGLHQHILDHHRHIRPREPLCPQPQLVIVGLAWVGREWGRRRVSGVGGVGVEEKVVARRCVQCRCQRCCGGRAQPAAAGSPPPPRRARTGRPPG